MERRGPVCLQGGAEFGPTCRDLDAAVLTEVSDVDGPVVLLPAAGAPGREYDAAGRHGQEHYRRLVVGGRDVVVATDPRDDEDACVEALSSAALVVLPGGSPSRLRDVLVDPRPGYPVTTRVGAVVLERLAAGAGVSGASAGAMVLCEHVALPDRRRGDVVPVLGGLGVVAGCVLPHWAAAPTTPAPSSASWLPSVRDALPAGTPLWGLGECSGLVLHQGRLSTGGPGPVVRVLVDGEVPVGPDDAERLGAGALGR